MAKKDVSIQIRTIVLPKMNSWLAYLTATILTLVLLLGVTRFYAVDLAIPFDYFGDSLFYMVVIKGLVNNEWSLFSVPQSTHLGAPFGFTLHDAPHTGDSSLMFLIVKGISFFFKDYFKVYNCYFLFTFFLTTYSSIYAFRYYRVSYKIAVVFSILYSFLPYHFMRFLGHGNLSLYALIPLIVLILLWIWSRRPIFFRRADGKYILDVKNHKSIFAIVVLTIASMTNIYYNLFFCFFALMAGISAGIYRKSFRHLQVSFILIAIVGSTVLLNYAPYIKYRIDQGTNIEALNRSIMEAEVFSLKIAQLFLPVDDHRVSLLAKIKNEYNTNPLINENSYAVLGIFGSMGLSFLLINFLFLRRRHKTIHDKLGLLTICAILFATIGGFSSLFALLVISTFRCYNRISIFIGFFSFMPLVLALNKYQKKIPILANYAVLAAVLLIGIFDQTTPNFEFTRDYPARKEEFISDRQFIKEIEKAAPKNALIFQFPAIGFPETTADVYNLVEYNLAKGYLHSDTLNWTYGSVSGRFPLFWYKSMAESAVAPLLYNLSIAEFAGIYIDRDGFSDNAEKLELELSQHLSKQPLISMNKKLSYFDMTAYRDGVLQGLSKEKISKLRELTLYPTQEIWEGDFSTLEKLVKESWRWCGKSGRLTLVNHSNHTRTQRLYMEFPPVQPDPFEIVIQGKDFLNKVQVSDRLETYERTVTLGPKEKIVIEFTSHAPPLDIPTEPRSLVFAVFNFSDSVALSGDHMTVR